MSSEGEPLVVPALDASGSPDVTAPTRASVERIEEHYSTSFAKTAGQAEAVITAWVGSLALFFVVALLPLQDTTRRIAGAEARVQQASATQAKNTEVRSQQAGSELITLSPDVRVLVDQLVSLEVRRTRGRTNPNDNTLGKPLEERLAKVLQDNPNDARRIAGLRQREKNRRLELLQQAEGIRGRRSRDSTALVGLRRQVTQTPTPIGDVPVPALLVPTAWLVLAGGLLTYAAMRRRALLSTLARWIAAARITRSPAEGLITDAPFWLAPLSSRIDVADGDPVTAGEMSRFLGWSSGGASQRLALGFCAIAGLLVTLWVAWIAFTMGTYYTDPHTGFRVTAVGLLAAGACWGTAVFLWFAPLARPVHEYHSISRRQWLGVTLASACGAYLLSPRGVLPSWATFSARRVRKPQRPAQHQKEVASAFSLHAGTGVVHFISEAGIHSDGLDLTKADLLPVSEGDVKTLLIDPAAGRKILAQRIVDMRRQSRPAQLLLADVRETSAIPVPTPRLLPSQHAALLEISALQERRKGNVAEATRLLHAGLLADDAYRMRSGRKPSYRLYDLYAACLFDRDDRPGFADLAEHIRNTWPLEPVLAERLLHWDKRLNDKPDAVRHKTWIETYTASPRFRGLWQPRTRTPIARSVS